MKKPAIESNTKDRITTGLWLAAGSSTVLYLGGIPFLACMSAIAWIANSEFSRLLRLGQQRLFDLSAHLSSIFLILASGFLAMQDLPPLLASSILDGTTFVIFLLLLIPPLLLGKFESMPLFECKAILSVLLSGWSIAHFVLLRSMSSGFSLSMLLVACVAANDIGAYVVGRTCGKHKLSATISPGKTWEGFIGGTLATVVTAVICSALLHVSVTFAIVLSTLISVLSPCGDLIISVLKRDSGTKDAGHFLPGHGGMLDRIGSYLLITPLFHYICVSLTLK